MKAAAEIIIREIKNQKSRFVFPSETAAALWALKAPAFSGERSLARNRFLAWDRFKETAVRSEMQNREPVSAVLRKLFTQALVKKNAAAASGGSGMDRKGAALRTMERRGGENNAAPENKGTVTSPPSSSPDRFPFHALIPPEFAEDGAVFAAEIASLLPSLRMLRERQGGGQLDDEDLDFVLLEKEYGNFLESCGLFEPSWEKPPLGDRKHEYYIFFPEAIEDWEEYRELLCAEPSVHVIGLDREDAGEDSNAAAPVLCHSSRTEIRSAALEIRRLHEKEGVPYDDMAVSAADLAGMESYILRDFGLYDIPVRRRAGKALADYGAGKIFPLISACVTNNFSFDSLKALLLSDQIPWRYPEMNRALIEFGVANNCVSGYRDRGVFVDIWLEALRRDGREEKLRAYYEELKEKLKAMAAAKKFSEVRRQWFAFRGRRWEETLPDSGAEEARIREAYPGAEHPGSVFQGFLSRDACSVEGDAVLARCIEELSLLCRLEETYADLIPPSPFIFFIEELREKLYVPVRSETGVNVFPYRVAAGAPFAAHFVLGASQEAATVLYQPLRFLRKDKRKRLGLADSDASAAFFRLYRPGKFKISGGVFASHTWISASERTFSGWAVPHSYFAAGASFAGTWRAPPPLEDLFQKERDWWAAGPSAGFPQRLFDVQQQGFRRWYAVLEGGGQKNMPGKYTFMEGAFDAGRTGGKFLQDRIDSLRRVAAVEGKTGGKAGAGGLLLKVSATDLNKFFLCPLLWLLEDIFNLQGQDLEARLLDDASLGLLYHEILKNLFAKIRDEDRIFKAGNLEKYRLWAEDCTRNAAAHYPAFQGPLAVPLLVSMARTIAKKIRGILDLERHYFPEYTVSELEAPLELRQGNLLFKGRLDRVSVSPEGVPCIIDYKTGAPPAKSESTADEDFSLEDFQIPMYVKLYEEKTGALTGGAFFISINKQDITAVVGRPVKKRGNTREEYQLTLDVLETYIDRFEDSVNALDFAPDPAPYETCVSCVYKGVCRSVYSLNPPADRKKKREAGHVL